MKYNLLLVFLLFVISLKSQHNYTPLQSQGEVPVEVFEDILNSYDAKINQHSGEKNFRLKKDFYIEHLYSIKKVFENGDILFGDEVSLYINDVAAQVLSMIPEIEHKVKVFVYKDYTVNAYSTQKGVLFVNMGLIAQVENEAQLAFVLAHELIHYAKNHGIERYVEKETLKRKIFGANKNFFKYLTYAKEQEFEADLLAITDIYLKLGYDINEALKVFDVLLYSYLPFDEIEFNFEIFQDEYYILTDDIKNAPIEPITAIEDYNDTNHTHPNIKKRRENIYEKITEIEVPDSGLVYLVSEKRFLNAQKIARYEICQLYLNETNFGKALYTTYLLKLKDTNNLYLDRIFAYSLYAISKYRNYIVDKEHKMVEAFNSNPYSRVDYKINEDAGKFKLEGVEGSSSAVYKLLNNMKDDELNILALKTIYETHLKYPENEFLIKLLDDIIFDLVKFHEIEISAFKTANEIIKADTTKINELSQEEYNKLSKYDKIKYDKEKNKLALKSGMNETFKYYALVNYTQDTVLIKSFEKAVSKVKFDKLLDNLSINDKNKFTNNEIDKIVITNPMVDYSIADETKYFKTLNLIKRLEYSLRKVNKHQDQSIITLSAMNLKSSDINTYNDIALIMSYYKESFNHLSIDDYFKIIPSNLAYIDNLRKKYNTDYFSFTYISDQDRADKVFGRYIDYYFINFDLELGSVTYLENRYFKSRSYKFILNSLLYNSFFNIKNNLDAKK